MATSTKTTACDMFIALYAEQIAFVTEEDAATTVDGLADQLTVASERLEAAGITGADDLDIAAVYLRDAIDADDATQNVLAGQIANRLACAPDMVDEYRLMV